MFAADLDEQAHQQIATNQTSGFVSMAIRTQKNYPLALPGQIGTCGAKWCARLQELEKFFLDESQTHKQTLLNQVHSLAAST